MDEPSILDYLKSRLSVRNLPGRKVSPQSGQMDSIVEIEPIAVQSKPAGPNLDGQKEIERGIASVTMGKSIIPWRLLLALVFALLGQLSLSPGPNRDWLPGVLLLAVAIGLLGWSLFTGELKTTSPAEQSVDTDPPIIHVQSLFIGLILGLITFLAFGTLSFNWFNTGILFLSTFLTIRAFYIPAPEEFHWKAILASLVAGRRLTIKITSGTLSAIFVVSIVIFFRSFRLADVPPEMNSDHAEKFLDILRILSGQNDIFFPNNGGREGLQFYLVAALHKLTGIPLDFIALKLVTVFIGLLSLPFIYLSGIELGSRRIGLLAFLFAGIAYWSNVVSRFGLRLPFYIFFTSAIFYFLLRGIRSGKRNYFLMVGILLGLSFYGYSADRILPFLIIFSLGLYLLHPQSKTRHTYILFSVLAITVISLILFLPLLRYIIAEPDLFLYRALTRMGSLERPIDNHPLIILIQNLGKALAMFSWKNGVIWPISIPDYPALSIVPGALFYIGIFLFLFRYIRQRNWLDLFIPLSIPILMIPSILSLAFPNENPNLYRTGGASVPVFLLVAFGLDSIITTIHFHMRTSAGRVLAYGLTVCLVIVSLTQDYELVFNTYYHQYRMASWNSSEMGQVIRGYRHLTGKQESVWVIGYPNWVDTRLVANQAGFPGLDYEIKIERLKETQQKPYPKLFLLNPQDVEAIEALKTMYPEGSMRTYKSATETKDFLIYFVSAQSDN